MQALGDALEAATLEAATLSGEHAVEAAPVTLCGLTDECLALLLARTRARTIALAGATCSALRRVVVDAVRQRVCNMRLHMPRDGGERDGGEEACALLARLRFGEQQRSHQAPPRLAVGAAHTLVIVEPAAAAEAGGPNAEPNAVVSFGGDPDEDDFFIGHLGRGAAHELSQSSDRGLPAPVAALGGNRIVELSAGRYHSMARCVLGAVYTWGWGREGQLGHAGLLNQEDSNVLVPRRVEALDGYAAVRITAGGYHSLATAEAREPSGSGALLFAWGWNEYGQLGLGDASHLGAEFVDTPPPHAPQIESAERALPLVDRPVPVRLDAVDGVASRSRGRRFDGRGSDEPWVPSAGEGYSLLLTRDGRVLGSGCAAEGRLGLGDERDRQAFEAIELFGPRPLSRPLAAGCSARGDPRACPAASAGGPLPAVQACAGVFSSIVLTCDGDAFAFGWGPFGTLGTGPPHTNGTCELSPRRVELSERVVQVAIGSEHSLFLTEGGNVLSCGLDHDLRLGQRGPTGPPTPGPEVSSEDTVLTPQEAPRLRAPRSHGRVIRVGAGDQHSVALTSSGSIVAVGEGSKERLGGTRGQRLDQRATLTLEQLRSRCCAGDLQRL